jgi:PiT family inorganic phosphate transporter
VLTPAKALMMASVLNLLGAMSGTAVAFTIGTEIVSPESVNVATVGAAMVAIIFWSTLAWFFGLPTSESHALVAGLAGAALAAEGPQALLWSGWRKVLLGLAFSSVLGFIAGLLLMTGVYRAFARWTAARVHNVFGRLQIVSSALVAFSHGSNDGQKFIGAFTLVLMLSGVIPAFQVQLWVILLCGGMLAIGTAVGGWRIVHTMGSRLTRLEPVHGFAAETGAAATIQLASALGVPLSTTHTITTAIMGVGATTSMHNVRWRVTKAIFAAWLLTFPVCAVIAWIVAGISRYLLR